MFTGIVTALGRVTEVKGEIDRRFRIDSPYNPDGYEIGASISHAGACLTVVEKGKTSSGGYHIVEVSPETLARTSLGDWKLGSRVNLERALKMGDELGGHLVTGHVDGQGEVIERDQSDGWLALKVKAPEDLAKFIAEKGSIAVDGVSLTVNLVERNTFALTIIPHTAAVTTLGELQVGAKVNLEVDLMARYAARLMQAEG